MDLEEVTIAQLEYAEHYSNVHDRLVRWVEQNFASVQSGHQGDSWVWIFDDEYKVAIDTFNAMQHQIKSHHPQSELAERVVLIVGQRFNLKML